MSAFNAFFAQLTGGGNAAGGGAPSNTAGSSSRDRRGSATADGGGGGGVSGGAGVGGEVFGVPLTGAAVTYDPENDRSRFGTPQVRWYLSGRAYEHTVYMYVCMYDTPQQNNGAA